LDLGGAEVPQDPAFFVEAEAPLVGERNPRRSLAEAIWEQLRRMCMGRVGKYVLTNEIGRDLSSAYPFELKPFQ
jgi:hypothetical protein